MINFTAFWSTLNPERARQTGMFFGVLQAYAVAWSLIVGRRLASATRDGRISYTAKTMTAASTELARIWPGYRDFTRAIKGDVQGGCRPIVRKNPDAPIETSGPSLKARFFSSFFRPQGPLY